MCKQYNDGRENEEILVKITKWGMGMQHGDLIREISE